MSTDTRSSSPEEQLTSAQAEPTAQEAPAASPTPGQQGESTSPLAGKRHIKIGSQREAPTEKAPSQQPAQQPEPAAPPSPPEETPPLWQAPAAPVELPPLHEMPMDLEQEIDAALGGMSLDEIIASHDPADSGEELELETRRLATVVRVHRDNVFFSLGGRHEGVASLKQFEQPPEPGTALEVIVYGLDTEENLYELTIPGASVAVADWADLTEGITIEVHVTGHNKGGLECEVNRIRGFIPASQISLYRIEDLSEMVGQKLLCVVTEADPERRNLVLSRRAVLEREKEAAREELIQSMQVGQVREGVVRSLKDFGAFVDLGGVDGLIHVSQLSWDRVAHPSDVLTEGQRVKVKLLKLDPNTGKLSLSYRETMENPWTSVASKYAVGAVVTGSVSKIADFGAFVKLEPGVEGLIHISELAHHRVQRVNTVVRQDQQLEVKVLSVDPDAQRISLSLKAIQAQVPPQEEEPSGQEEQSPPPARSQRSAPLKGGLERPSGVDRFGLNW